METFACGVQFSSVFCCSSHPLNNWCMGTCRSWDKGKWLSIGDIHVHLDALTNIQNCAWMLMIWWFGHFKRPVTFPLGHFCVFERKMYLLISRPSEKHIFNIDQLFRVFDTRRCWLTGFLHSDRLYFSIAWHLHTE